METWIVVVASVGGCLLASCGVIVCVSFIVSITIVAWKLLRDDARLRNMRETQLGPVVLAEPSIRTPQPPPMVLVELGPVGEAVQATASTSDNDDEMTTLWTKGGPVVPPESIHDG